MVTYRHAIQRQLAVNFKLIGRGHSSTGVHQGITELRNNIRNEKGEEFLFCGAAAVSFV